MGGRPQQPELNRSGHTALNPDSIAGEMDVRDVHPKESGRGGPVPEENRPGHHPERDQDKPDPEAFAAKARRRGRSRAQPARQDGRDRRPAPDRPRGRGPLIRAGLTAAGAVGAAVGVSRALRRRRAA